MGKLTRIASANAAICMATVANDPEMLSSFAANPYLPSQWHQIMYGKMYMNDDFRNLDNGGGMGPRSDDGSGANRYLNMGYRDQTQVVGFK